VEFLFTEVSNVLPGNGYHDSRFVGFGFFEDIYYIGCEPCDESVTSLHTTVDLTRNFFLNFTMGNFELEYTV
jgi:hypothetical protein